MFVTLVWHNEYKGHPIQLKTSGPLNYCFLIGNGTAPHCSMALTKNTVPRLSDSSFSPAVSSHEYLLLYELCRNPSLYPLVSSFFLSFFKCFEMKFSVFTFCT